MAKLETTTILTQTAIKEKLILIKPTLVFIALFLPASAMSFPDFPRNELPFCPSGGPAGWMNYFDYKRDQNIWRRYPNFQSPYLRPYYQRSSQKRPSENRQTYYAPAFKPLHSTPQQ
jgi:hypothetical protein